VTRRRGAKRPPKKPTRAAALKRAHQDRFLEQFVSRGSVFAAAAAANVHRSMHYDWLKDPAYAARFAAAETDAADLAETEVRRRAIVGVDEPVYYKGKVVGSIKKFSDTLLMFWLNGRRSDVFRPRLTAAVEPGDGVEIPMKFTLNLDVNKPRS
jgi:hypothetical protein